MQLISIGQIIDKTWDNYSDHFKSLMKISLWAFIIPPLMILRVFLSPSGEIQSLAMMIEGHGGALDILGMIVGALIAVIVVPVITIWIYINLVNATDLQNKKKTFSFKELSSVGFKIFFPYLWVAIIRNVIIALPMLAVVPGLIIIFWNIYGNGGSILGGLSIFLTFVGIVAALILTIMLAVQLSFAGYERILNDKKGFKAISGSRALVKNRFWKTLWRLFVPKLVFGIVAGLLQIVGMVIVIAIMYASYSINDTFGIIFTFIVASLVSTGVAVLTTPIFVIIDYIIYGNLLETRK